VSAPTVYAEAVLDSAQRLTLRAVAGGECNDTPALRSLVERGLVERTPEGGCVVTGAGEEALREEPLRRRSALVRFAGAAIALYFAIRVLMMIV
jgi:hypothetical protein